MAAFGREIGIPTEAGIPHMFANAMKKLQPSAEISTSSSRRLRNPRSSSPTLQHMRLLTLVVVAAAVVVVVPQRRRRRRRRRLWRRKKKRKTWTSISLVERSLRNHKHFASLRKCNDLAVHR